MWDKASFNSSKSAVSSIAYALTESPCAPRHYCTSLPPNMAMRRVSGLFDHLVGADESGRRHGEAERPGGLQVNDQLQLRGLFDRQVTRLCPFQDLVNIGGGPPGDRR